MKLVIGSRDDKASVNVLNHLLSFDDFDKKIKDDFVIYVGKLFSIAEITGSLIYADHIDEKLSDFLEFEEILFISRHSSKDGRKIFTAHVSGNPGNNEYGGKPKSLAKPSPMTLKNYFLSLGEKIDKKPEFELTLEATHHGPSEISKPSAFYEIGSTEEEWIDRTAGEIVAEAIYEAIKSDKKFWKVSVGIGGTHYIPRQTELMLETEFTFGHNFAKYTFECLDEKILKKAIELSSAKFIIYDEKSVTSKVKYLMKSIDGIKVLKSREAKKFGLQKT
ncbi:MAG: D-aminoacyl-tRNA deacylase [Archaeoglobaceae archaeon]|nr:D-aminoacyl-tRNA deacylase [Archaeoglobaceae archaeon]MDW7989233.1 D-aminoacyl-tRNA deacylase [Archaeoglobaceae archaeon]